MEEKNYTNPIEKALDHAQKAMPSVELMDRMESVAVSFINNNGKFSLRTLWALAASFLLLVSLNFVFINQSRSVAENNVEPEEETYEWVPVNTLYNE